MRIRRKHVADEVVDLETLAGVPGDAEDRLGDSQLVGLSEGVCEVTKRVENTAEHPDVCLRAHLIPEERVHDLGWAVHRRRVLLYILLVGAVLGAGQASEVHCAIGAGTEITELVAVVCTHQDVLDLDVPVRVADAVETEQPARYAVDNPHQVLFGEASRLPAHQLIEERTIRAQLHKDHHRGALL